MMLDKSPIPPPPSPLEDSESQQYVALPQGTLTPPSPSPINRDKNG